MTQDDLAAALGTSRKVVIQWEKHDKGPGEDYAGKLSDLFGGPLEDWLGPTQSWPDADLESALQRLEDHLDQRLGQLQDDVSEQQSALRALQRSVETLLRQTQSTLGAG